METYEDIIRNRVDFLLAILKWLFNVTLGVNTVLFLLGLIAIGDESTLTIVFTLMIITSAINLVVFLVLLAFSFVYACYKRSLIIGSLVLLANIPVTILYLTIISAFDYNGIY